LKIALAETGKQWSFVRQNHAQGLNCGRLNLQEPKAFFPKMPADVFDQWIAPQIPVYGWPFSSIDCATTHTKWHRFFAGRTLAQWASFDFLLNELPYRTLMFEDKTDWRIEGIFDHCSLGLQTQQANIYETVNRFRACAEFIHLNGRLPRPVIGFLNEGLIEIIDGHHRLAALRYIGVRPDFKVPIWMIR
jgi:hypothetical protein